ncbi:hypothetical protein [Kordia sp.]
MLKNLLEIGKPLNKVEQQAINGGGICCSFINEDCCHISKPWDD